MKVAQAAIVAFILAECQAYVVPQRSQRTSPFLVLRSSTASNDAAFSAFAETLEEQPDAPKEKSWQAKLDDFLNPTTNPAERQVLLSELLSSNEQIRESVMDALANRKVGMLQCLDRVIVTSAKVSHT